MLLIFIIKLLFLFVFLSNPSPCLQTAPISATELPGFQGALPFLLQTGYVTVDDGIIGSELFYYFIESESEPGRDPVLLWLTGGPGCSSFFGLYQEIGPFRFKRVPYNGTLPTLVYNPYTWTKIFNIIFLDWPPGSGFAFSKNYEHQILNDDQSMNQIYTFLKQWFVDHPNFLLNPFYVGGDSYGGKMATLVSYRIVQGNEAFDRPLINLKGYLIGNPRTGIDEFDVNTRVAHAHGMGIISDELKELVERNCVGEDYIFPRTALCTANLLVFQKFLDEIVIDNILSPKCLVAEAILRNDTDSRISNETAMTDPNCPDFVSYLAWNWMNNYTIREALGVKEGTVKFWTVCNQQLKRDYIENIPSTLPYHNSLLIRGYRALVYSGDHDLQFPTMGTLKWIESLNFPVIEQRRSWKVSGQVAGYTMLHANNLTFATVLGAGHEAPQDKPKQCWAMLKRWISYEPL